MSTNSSEMDVELLAFNFTRNHYENKYNKQYLPIALKYVIIQFSKRVIASKLLTLKDDLALFSLLSTKISCIRRFNLLFTASDHGYLAAKFHELCDDKGPTITIIKSNWQYIWWLCFKTMDIEKDTSRLHF